MGPRARQTLQRTVTGSLISARLRTLGRLRRDYGPNPCAYMATPAVAARGPPRHQGPKTRSEVADITPQRSSGAMPRTCAITSTVSGIRYDAFGRPR